MLRNTRGNTLAIMAIAMVPLAGLMGGGIDISRMYITKTRLQHACDAGALAGRKAMGGGTWSQSNGLPNTTAQQFFDANFPTSSYGGRNLTRSFSESAGKVTGTASLELQMTLVKVVTKDWSYVNLAVTCDAEMRLPNTDVMFVLDTTGSMGDTPSGDSMTKIASLKIAVKCFYEIVARLDTDANCTTGTPSGGTGNQTQIRFGFVPYATNVNIGKLLPTAWFADTWHYQTRQANWTPATTYTYPNPGTPTVTNTSYNWITYGSWVSKQFSKSGSGSSNCKNNVPADTTPIDTGSEGGAYNTSSSTSGGVQTVTWNTDTSSSKYNYRYNSYKNGTCYYDQRPVTGTKTLTYSRSDTGVPQTTQVFSNWNYAQLDVNVGLLKNGTSWNSSFQWPIGPNGTNATINWDGCVEERDTVSQASYDPIPSGAKDLDLDSVPTPGDISTMWKPVLPDLIKTRNGTNSYYWTLNGSNTTNDYGNGSYYACPQEAKKLQSWTDPTAFDAYVDGLSPEGNTYHDIGLIWGGRLLSPTGLFASENAYTPQGGEIERHMIFMTDGDPCTGINNYTAYGVNWYDRRTVGASTTPTEGCTTSGNLTAQVNARTAALCTAIKNKNITLWVITFGTLASDTVTRMTACASPGRYFNATNAATIQQTFASIADQISQLRLTK
ncbi:MAG: TadE/TadG family type IV pilus assembly protein [Sphingomonas sp.]|uniref:pilus assembly protein TadG-related protein n=1 Tax=Sphingomonas sp. TaxID=28214 RepID=UPI003562E8C1